MTLRPYERNDLTHIPQFVFFNNDQAKQLLCAFKDAQRSGIKKVDVLICILVDHLHDTRSVTGSE